MSKQHNTRETIELTRDEIEALVASAIEPKPAGGTQMTHPAELSPKSAWIRQIDKMRPMKGQTPEWEPYGNPTIDVARCIKAARAIPGAILTICTTDDTVDVTISVGRDFACVRKYDHVATAVAIAVAMMMTGKDVRMIE